MRGVTVHKCRNINTRRHFTNTQQSLNMAFIRRLFRRGTPSTKPKQVNGAPATMNTGEVTSQMNGLSLHGPSPEDAETATFALS